jgi:hypothetical protein
MDLSKLIQMIVNTILKRVINQGVSMGINAGMKAMPGTKKTQDPLTPEEQDQARLAKDMARRARQAAKLTRKF